MLQPFNSDVQIIFMNRMNTQIIEQFVAQHRDSVKTNTDLANKEVWFIADNIEHFIFAFESDMQTPTGTEINKRLIFLATHTPDWQKQLINPIKQNRRILCIAKKAAVRRAFWVLVWKLQLKKQLNRWLDLDSVAMKQLAPIARKENPSFEQ